MFNNSISCERLSVSDLHLLAGPSMQKKLSDLMDEKISSQFFKAPSSSHDKARKLSVRCSESGGFLRATPNPKVTWMTNDEWITAIKLRLGLPLHFIPFGCKLRCKKVVDTQGYHFFSCKNGGEHHKTHDDLAAQIFSLGRSAGLSGKLEPLLNH